jgi:hypothetical protein
MGLAARDLHGGPCRIRSHARKRRIMALGSFSSMQFEFGLTNLGNARTAQ